MTIEEQVHTFIAALPEPKRGDVQALHDATLRLLPGCRLWFSDGRDEHGKVVTNPSIGYDAYTIRYADGTSKEFYRVGLSANKTGISVYILGLEDRTYLPRTIGATIGKATVTGYCVRFKSVKDIHLGVLQAAMRHGVGGG